MTPPLEHHISPSLIDSKTVHASPPDTAIAMLEFALLLLSLAGASLGYDSDTKVWLPNTNFANPNNWDLNRVPCDKDRVIFPSGLDLGIALPEGRTALRELVLPMYGEIILPLNGVLEIGDGKQKESKCPGEDIAFSRSGTKSWLDPANWKIETQEGDFARGAAPHFDTIPCEHDRVQFAEGVSVKIQMPQVNVVVGTLKFGNQELSNTEWISWLNSDTGFRQFVGRWEERESALTVQPTSNQPCTDKAGCVCQSSDPKSLLEHVCRFESPRCPTPMCYSPITPQGHCCQICGSTILLKHDASFDFAVLKRLLLDYLKDEENSNFLIHAKKSAFEKDSVQVVIVEKGRYEGTSGALASRIADDILKDMSLGAKKVTVSSSGPMYLGSKLAAAAKTTFSTFAAVLIFLAITFYVFVVYRKGLPFGASKYQLFQFARFENVPGDEDGVLAIGSEPGFADDSPSKCFDNPLYGTDAGGSQGAKALEGNDGAGVHQNPIYSELKKRVAEEEKEEDTDSGDDTDDSDEESQRILEKPEEDFVFKEILFDKDE